MKRTSSRKAASLLLRGGRIVDPARGVDETGDLLIRDGKVEHAGKTLPKSKTAKAEIIDVSGLVVAPGFIDMHVHLREPGREEAETIETGCKAAVAGGFTSVACMANTCPVNDNRSTTEFILAQTARAKLANVFPVAAVTRGLAGTDLTNMGELKEAGAVAVSDDGHPIVDSELLRRALSYARTFDLTLIEHCEDPYLFEGTSMNEGLVSTLLGLRGSPTATESVMVERAIALAKLTEGKLHIAHLSTADSADAVRRAKAKGIPVTAEVTPHHFTLTDEAVRGYDTNAKVNPPLRSEEDVAAVIEAIRDQTIDCIASDHAPHHEDFKKLEFGRAPFGLIGLETEVSLSIDRLYHSGIVSIARLVEMFTVNPARILAIPRGTLAPGAEADVTLLDLDRRITVNRSSMHSRSRNTPFDGMKLRGMPVMTIVSGRILQDTRTRGRTKRS